MLKSILVICYIVTLASLLLVSGCQTVPPQVDVTILHWNDFHARNLPYETVMRGDTVRVGGAAYLAAMLDSLEALEPNPIALHAGDEFTGSPICSMTDGQSQIELLNLILPDAFEIGNHEFDPGWTTLKEKLAQAKFPVLCANVFDSTTGQPIGLTYLILKRGGAKIAIIGVNTRGLDRVVMKQNIAGLRIEDPIPIVNGLLDRLEPVTDIQIALTHHGIDEDRRLAQACPRLELIVGGHQHYRTYEPVMENGVPILQAGANGQFLGRFRAVIDTKGDSLLSFEGELLPVYCDSVTPRQDIADLVTRQEASILDELERVVGVLKVPWERHYSSESNIGDWTADAFARVSGCDIGIINSGGLRSDLPAGPVTVRNLWEVHPFSNRVVAFDITGEELYQLVSHLAKEESTDIQIGNMRFRAKVGTGQVLELTVGGLPVDRKRAYTAAISEFAAEQFGKYTSVDLGGRELRDTGYLDREIAEKALEEEGEVAAQIDGRMGFVQ